VLQDGRRVSQSSCQRQMEDRAVITDWWTHRAGVAAWCGATYSGEQTL
jgi:hypothetical protein